MSKINITRNHEENVLQKIVVWGNNQHGQLGLGSGQEKVIEQPLKMPFMRCVVKVSLGQNHAGFITNQMQLFMTGDNRHGQLGIGSEKISNAFYPTMVAGLAQQHVIDVACGYHHTLALTNNKNLWLCGSNEFGQLSIQNSNQPVYDIEISKLKADAIFAGADQSFVVSDSRVYACGSNQFGKLGLNSSVNIQNEFAQLAISNVSKISTSQTSTLALLHSGRVLETSELEGFVQIEELINISQIAAGQINGALDSNGNLYSWQPLQTDQQLLKVLHGHLVEICIGNGQVGITRDKNDKLYEWGYNTTLNKINKKASLVFQGGDSTIIIKRKRSLSQKENSRKSYNSGVSLNQPSIFELKTFTNTDANRKRYESYNSSYQSNNPLFQRINKNNSLSVLNKQNESSQSSNQFQTESAARYDSKVKIASPSDSGVRSTSRHGINVYGMPMASSKRKSSITGPFQVEQQDTHKASNYHRTPFNLLYDHSNPRIDQQAPLTENHRFQTSKTRFAQQDEHIGSTYNSRRQGQVQTNFQNSSQSDLEKYQTSEYRSRQTKPLSKYKLFKQKSAQTINILQSELQRVKIENEDLLQRQEKISNYQSSRLDQILKEDNQLRQIIQSQNLKSQSLNEQMRHAENTIRSQEQHIKELASDFDRVREELQDTKLKLHKLETSLSDTNLQNQLYQSQVEDTNEKNQDLQKKLRKLAQEKQEMAKMGEDGSIRINTLQNQVEHLHTVITNLNAEIQALTNSKISAEQLTQKVTDEKILLQRHNDVVQAQNLNLTMIIEELELNNKALIRFMDQKNYSDAKNYTDHVLQTLQQQNRRQAMGSSLRQPLEKQYNYTDGLNNEDTFQRPQLSQQQDFYRKITVSPQQQSEKTDDGGSFHPKQITSIRFEDKSPQLPKFRHMDHHPSFADQEFNQITNQNENSNQLNKLFSTKDPHNKDVKLNRSTELFPSVKQIQQQSLRLKSAQGRSVLLAPNKNEVVSNDQLSRVQAILRAPRNRSSNVEFIGDKSVGSDDLTASQKIARVSSLVTKRLLRDELNNMSAALQNMRRDHQDVRDGILRSN